MKPKSFPVYCIESYPNHSKNKGDFYMTKLEDLVKEFKGIDQSHSHSFYMVMYVKKGSGTHTIDFVTYSITANQLFFLTPGQVHNWALEPETEGFALFFEANYFSTIYNQRLAEYAFFHTNLHSPLLQIDKENLIFNQLFTEAFQEFSDLKPNRNDVFLAHLFILLENINRHYESLQNPEITVQFSKIRQFEDFMNKYFLEKKEIKDYADLMNISPNYLNAICKNFLNKTASQLLHERLIVEAKRLLTHSNLSIKEIVFHLGFNDASYFTRFFKKLTNKTPVEFRKEYNSI
jgi:AraC family transcriptional regulator, transcriptional activator of pobA